MTATAQNTQRNSHTYKEKKRGEKERRKTNKQESKNRATKTIDKPMSEN